MKKILWFFDKLEDRVRGFLSHYPIGYAFVAGLGMVLFWRGIWHTIDMVSGILVNPSGEYFVITNRLVWDGLVSIAAGSVLLLMSGSFVSTFIGNEIIISGLRGEKKLTEKTESEVRTETGAIAEISDRLDEVAERLERIEKKITAGK